MKNIVQDISITELKVHPENTKYFDDIKGPTYERFKKSIKEEGIITPLILSSDKTIISGHQRYKAACELNIKTVPVIIKKELKDENEKLKKLLASNFGRMKNNPIKQGKIILKYEDLCGVQRGNPSLLKTAPLKTQKEIAEELGIGIDTLKRLKNLQKLAPEVQSKIENEELGYTTALKVFGKLPFEKQKEVMAKFSDVNLKGITSQSLIQMIEMEDYSLDTLLNENTIGNINKKIRATCTHMLKEMSISTSTLINLNKKCENKITLRNRNYIEKNIELIKELLTTLEEEIVIHSKKL